MFSKVVQAGLFLILALPAYAQTAMPTDLTIPENQVQGKPGEPKSDVPLDSLSIGNQEDEAGPGSPSAADIPPPQSSKPAVKKQKATATPQLEPFPTEMPPPSEDELSKDSPASPLEDEPANGTPKKISKDTFKDTSKETTKEYGQEPEMMPENPPPPSDAETTPAEDTQKDSGSVMIDTSIGDSDDQNQAPKNKICNCQFTTSTPYTDRRSSIGGIIGVEGGTYQPVNYQPDFNSATFSNYYDKVSPNAELVFIAKLNFFLGSIGPQLTAGFFQATSTVDGAKLTVIPVTLGAIYALDNLFKEPYVVPYVVAGMYTDLYNETDSGQSVQGNSAFSEFYALGLMIQLDAIDEEAHNTAYRDFGLENTFLFVEARSFLPAQNDVPDFSTPLQISGGIKIEF